MLEIAVLIAAGAGILATTAYGLSKFHEKQGEQDPAKKLLKNTKI